MPGAPELVRAGRLMQPLSPALGTAHPALGEFT